MRVGMDRYTGSSVRMRASRSPTHSMNTFLLDLVRGVILCDFSKKCPTSTPRRAIPPNKIGICNFFPPSLPPPQTLRLSQFSLLTLIIREVLELKSIAKTRPSCARVTSNLSRKAHLSSSLRKQKRPTESFNFYCIVFLFSPFLRSFLLRSFPLP